MRSRALDAATKCHVYCAGTEVVVWGCHGYAPRGEKVGGGDATCRLCRVPGRAAQAVEGSVSRVTLTGGPAGRGGVRRTRPRTLSLGVFRHYDDRYLNRRVTTAVSYFFEGATAGPTEISRRRADARRLRLPQPSALTSGQRPASVSGRSQDSGGWRGVLLLPGRPCSRALRTHARPRPRRTGER